MNKTSSQCGETRSQWKNVEKMFIKVHPWMTSPLEQGNLREFHSINQFQMRTKREAPKFDGSGQLLVYSHNQRRHLASFFASPDVTPSQGLVLAGTRKYRRSTEEKIRVCSGPRKNGITLICVACPFIKGTRNFYTISNQNAISFLCDSSALGRKSCR